MPDDLRADLQAAAAKQGRTLTQEVIRRLRVSLREDLRADPALRGLNFLIAQLAHHVVGPTQRDWRSVRFFYEAFKIAVCQLLNALDPPGEIRGGKLTIKGPPSAAANPSLHRYAASFESPEARAAYTVDIVLSQFRDVPLWNDELRKKQARLIAGDSSLVDIIYGMPNAARDLAIKPQSDLATKPKSTGRKITLDVKTTYWGNEEPKS